MAQYRVQGENQMAKIVKIETIKAQANETFRASVDEFATQRRAIHYFVADLLMKANAYKGFRYLEASDVEPGKSIGLIRNPENAAGPHSFPDDSRIAFL
jgi:hypothetical protein